MDQKNKEVIWTRNANKDREEGKTPQGETVFFIRKSAMGEEGWWYELYSLRESIVVGYFKESWVNMLQFAKMVGEQFFRERNKKDVLG